MGSVFVSSVNLSFFFLLFFWHVLPFFTKSIQYHCALNTKSKSFIISRLSFIIRNHCFCVWAFPNPLKLKENCYFSRISWKKNLKYSHFHPSTSLYTLLLSNTMRKSYPINAPNFFLKEPWETTLQKVLSRSNIILKWSLQKRRYRQNVNNHFSETDNDITKEATCPGSTECAGIVLEFLLFLKMTWNWKIKLIFLKIRSFTFSMSWKILKCDYLKTFRSLICCK